MVPIDGHWNTNTPTAPTITTGWDGTATTTQTWHITGVELTGNCCYRIYYTDSTADRTDGTISELEDLFIRRRVAQYHERIAVQKYTEKKRLKLDLKAKKKYCNQDYDEIIQNKHSIQPVKFHKPNIKYTIKRYKCARNKYANRNLLTINST
jgi:hypothetical protein